MDEIKKANEQGTYKITVDIPVDGVEFRTLEYRFNRPAIASYDRYVKTMSKIGISQASKAFLLDAVIDADKDQLTADLAEYPGAALSMADKLTELLGLTNANLTKL